MVTLKIIYLTKTEGIPLKFSVSNKKGHEKKLQDQVIDNIVTNRNRSLTRGNVCINTFVEIIFVTNILEYQL